MPRRAAPRPPAGSRSSASADFERALGAAQPRRDRRTSPCTTSRHRPTPRERPDTAAEQVINNRDPAGVLPVEDLSAVRLLAGPGLGRRGRPEAACTQGRDAVADQAPDLRCGRAAPRRDSPPACGSFACARPSTGSRSRAPPRDALRRCRARRSSTTCSAPPRRDAVAMRSWPQAVLRRAGARAIASRSARGSAARAGSRRRARPTRSRRSSGTAQPLGTALTLGRDRALPSMVRGRDSIRCPPHRRELLHRLASGAR